MSSPRRVSDQLAVDLRRTAEAVAVEAAAHVRRGRRADLAVASTKSSVTDIVTAVDRESEALLRRRLAELRPGDGFVGEEGTRSRSTTGVTWVVDPIDGTVNFFYDVAPCCVSVAAVDQEARSLAGAVVEVGTGATYSAARGAGATLDGVPLQVRPPAPQGQWLVLTGFHYRVEVRTAQAEAVARLLPRVRDIRRIGSAALDLSLVARGAADAYVEEGLHLWDRAAAGLVAEEAGATVGVHRGTGGMDCVLAAPAAAYDELLALVRECGFLAADPD